MIPKLYSWQKKCLAAWENNNFRGILNVVTGAGKTVFALAAIRKLRDKYPDLRVKVVVPTIPLASQWIQALVKDAASEDERPGFFGGGRRDEPDRKVMVYIINSARDSISAHIRRDLSLKKHVLLICDECHHYVSRENRKIFGFLTPETEESPFYSSIGMSATPFGTADDELLIKNLGKEIFHYDFDSAVEDDIISPFTVCDVSASFSAAELNEYADLSEKLGFLLKRLIKSCPCLEGLDKKRFMKAVTKMANESGMDPEDPAAAFLMLAYRRKDLTNNAQARTQCALSLIGRLKPSDRILIFCERVEQAETLLRMIKREYGNMCAAYHSGIIKTARERIMNDFREGAVRILVSCRCLDEGIDVPDANIGIVMSGSAVKRQRIQRLGRIIRSSEGKEAACLYYIYIRQSSDDPAFLYGLDRAEHFRLKFFSEEDFFSNDLYEYSGKNLIGIAREKGYNDEQIRELRKCLSEGVVRADYLMPLRSVSKMSANARHLHERNYWNIMKRIGMMFREEMNNA